MRDEFSQDTKQVLAQRACLICSNPECHATTGGPQFDPAKALNLGVAAHITAASAGGARFDPSLSSEQRRSSQNGIWLCQNCAKKVDNDPVMHPTEILHAWKTVREFNARNLIGQTAPRIHETDEQKKSKKILDSIGKQVMVVKMPDSQTALRSGSRPWQGSIIKVLECNEFFVVIKGDSWDRSRSIAMDKLRLGWDGSQNCLEILEYD